MMSADVLTWLRIKVYCHVLVWFLTDMGFHPVGACLAGFKRPAATADAFLAHLVTAWAPLKTAPEWQHELLAIDLRLRRGEVAKIPYRVSLPKQAE
jgi:hypothetical protein